MAVKLTFDPKQIVEPLLLMLTEGGMEELTVIVMLLLEAVEDVTQFSEEVSVQVITSPLFSVEVVYVLLPDPTGEPLRYHW